MKNWPQTLTFLATLSLCPMAFAAGVSGVRHSRSLNGTGQPIPRAQPRAPVGNQPLYNPSAAVPYDTSGSFNPQQSGASYPTQGPVPVVIPPPVPVQIPTQFNPQQAPPSADTTPIQVPALASPETQSMPSPSSPALGTFAGNAPTQQQPAQPVPVQAQEQQPSQFQQPPQFQNPSEGQPQLPYVPPAPAVVPAPAQVPSPDAAPQPQNVDSVSPVQGIPTNTQQLQQSPVQTQQGLPSTPARSPVQNRFTPDTQRTQPSDPSLPVVAPLQQSNPPFPMQGQPNLAPVAPGGNSAGSWDRYMLPTYGMAGCGLGSMVFKKNVRSEQWLASIVNDFFLPQSSMITTGTSNCVDVDEEQSQAEQEIFIDSNFHTMRTDASRGDGESLRAFAELMGCHKEGLYDTFASISQGQFDYIFSDSQPRSVTQRYRNALKDSRALRTRCDRLF